MEVALLAIGSEILDGRINDTNSHWLARELHALHYRVQTILTCDDALEDICDALSVALRKSRVVIVCGGIGPTKDDKTREAIAQFLGVALEQDLEQLAALKERYQRKNRTLSPTNERQSYFPAGAQVIPNASGTAPGFVATTKDAAPGYIFSLPGVPFELKQMFAESVVPSLEAAFGSLPAINSHSFRILGLPESGIAEKVEECSLSEAITISYRAMFPLIEVVLKSREMDVDVAAAVDVLCQALGEDFIVSRNTQDTFVTSMHHLFLDTGESIAVAESCTGGLLGSMLTETPGSSIYFKGGVISYSNEAKQELLGVSAESLQQHGAVSHQVAQEMARGARERFVATRAVSITGVAGPDGGSEAKPVGTFFLGYADGEEVVSHHYFHSSDRRRVRIIAAHAALDMLRRKISGFPVRGPIVVE